MADQPTSETESSRYRSLGTTWTVIILVVTVVAVAIAVNQLFNLGFFKLTIGKVLVYNRYLYLVAGLMISMIFIVLPATKRSSRTRVPVTDAVLFVLMLCLTGYLVFTPRIFSTRRGNITRPITGFISAS